MQMRMSADDPRYYNVSRDLAHCFGPMLEKVADRLEKGHWPLLAEFAREKGVTQDDLGEALRAYAEFVIRSCENPDENMEDVLRRVGWFEINRHALIVLNATVGVTIMGMVFTSYRDATIGGEGPALQYAELVAGAENAFNAMHIPWYRRFYLWWTEKGTERTKVEAPKSDGTDTESD
jgi:hypothetical protein